MLLLIRMRSVCIQLNTNVIRGLVKRAQLLRNVHNISDTCTTSLKRAQHLWNMHIYNTWKHWVGAVKHVIPIYTHINIYIYVAHYAHVFWHSIWDSFWYTIWHSFMAHMLQHRWLFHLMLDWCLQVPAACTLCKWVCRARAPGARESSPLVRTPGNCFLMVLLLMLLGTFWELVGQPAPFQVSFFCGLMTTGSTLP